ncbi:hypothetical protein Tco_1080146, partial [Tanacetum coccineum]
MIDINTTGIALPRTSRLLRPQSCLLCPHAHRFAFVSLAWDFPQVTQTSATLTQARSTQFLAGVMELPPHLEYAFLEGDDKLPVIIAKDLKFDESAPLAQ